MTEPKRSGRSRKQRPIWKRVLFSCFGALLLTALLEGLCTGFWVIADIVRSVADAPEVVELKEDSHCQYDSELGWSHAPSTTISDFYGARQNITINADGVRALDPNESLVEGTDQFRVICLGDSFTLGYGVDDRNTFPWQLQEMSDGVQAVNMGQGGYSIGQCYLWLKRLGPKLKPNLVVGIFILEDFRRLGVTRTINGYSTPQFELSNRGVVVSNVPVPGRLPAGDLLLQRGAIRKSLLDHSSIARTVAIPFQSSATDGDAQYLIVGSEIIREMNRLCQKWGCEFVLVVTPTLPEMQEPSMLAAYRVMSQALRRFSATEQIRFVDLWQAFSDRHAEGARLFLSEQFHHYSVAGNKLVAEKLAELLQRDLGEGLPSGG